MPPRPHSRRRSSHKAARGPRNARGVAFAVLSEYKASSRFVSQLLDAEVLRLGDFSSEERRLAVELVNGVVRRQATLDALILPHCRRPRHRIEGELWTLLQLGTYQLAFLDAIPGYAAVNETVELAGAVGRQRWSGFLNGTLRSVQRSLTDQFVPEAAADALPLSMGRHRLLTDKVFADPSADPIRYVAEAFSFPRWLIDRWHRRFDFADLCRLGFWFDKPAPLSLRVSLLRGTREQLLASLAERGIAANPGNLPESIRLPNTLRVETLPGFAEGLFAVQDESAMEAVDLLAPQPGETILDLCAAPGTKTTHIAERMQNAGTIIATDIRADRLARIDENCRRLGISIVRTSLISPSGDDIPSGPFDAILVDAPCSNTGVLGKRPEARWRINASEIEELTHRQQALLQTASGRLKPGGRIVYSTCSIEPEENEQLIERVLHANPHLVCVRERHLIPGQPADGGFQALLKSAPVSASPSAP